MKDNSPINTIRWFEDLGSEDVPAVGGGNASLGELQRDFNDCESVPGL